MGISAVNALLALKVISDLTSTATHIADMIQKAQDEGRDVTPEEINEAKSRAKSSIEKLKESLQERKQDSEAH